MLDLATQGGAEDEVGNEKRSIYKGHEIRTVNNGRIIKDSKTEELSIPYNNENQFLTKCIPITFLPVLLLSIVQHVYLRCCQCHYQGRLISLRKAIQNLLFYKHCRKLTSLHIFLIRLRFIRISRSMFPKKIFSKNEEKKSLLRTMYSK